MQYFRGMPGATCLAMDAGDFAIYHPVGWHLGSVLTYRKRATIHDVVFSPESRAWFALWNGWKAEQSRRVREQSAANSL